MIYTELIVVILGISLTLYVILGGADFGAGIVEIFTGDQGNEVVSKAMAPVWEANHMWLVIAVVILFNGFPEAYRILSTNLHIPVLLFLIGIVLRGTAFTFRHYDAFRDGSQKVYSAIFRYSSLFTVFFLGVTISAFFGGTLPETLDGSFSEVFIFTWFNPFSISVGIFAVALSAYIAAIFLLGEVETERGYEIIKKFSYRLFVLSTIAGVGIFTISYIQDLSFHKEFVAHPISIVVVALATMMVPYIFILIRQKKIWKLRIVVGSQVLMIMLGWFFIQWPNLIFFNNGQVLSIYDAASPTASMKVLFVALAVGVVIIFPALFYLFKIFKA